MDLEDISGDVYCSLGLWPSRLLGFTASFAALFTKCEIGFFAFHDCLRCLGAEAAGLLAARLLAQIRDEVTAVVDILRVEGHSAGADEEAKLPS